MVLFYFIFFTSALADCALGLCLPPICLFLFGLQRPSKAPDGSPLWLSEDVSGGTLFKEARWTLVMEKTAFSCQFPTRIQRAASLMLCWVSVGVLPGVSRGEPKTQHCSACFPSRMNCARPIKHHLYQSAVPVYFPFSLWFYCLKPLCFLTTPATPIIPPFSPHESDFVDTPHPSLSQVNNFGCTVG